MEHWNFISKCQDIIQVSLKYSCNSTINWIWRTSLQVCKNLQFNTLLYMLQILCREFSQNKSVRSNSRKARRDWRRSLLPQKLLDFSENWHMYLSSAPRICAPTPVKRGPCTNLSRSLIPSRNSGFSTEYMKQKLCLHSGMATLKYHPSKKGLAVPSKWYLQNDLAKIRYSRLRLPALATWRYHVSI